jgi:cell division protein FtsB
MTDRHRTAPSHEETSKTPPVSPRAAAMRRRRRFTAIALGFVAMVLLVDGIVGERGLIEMLRARRQHRDLADGIASARQENARLRAEARRLREDPKRIEELARSELGLIRPGEIVVIVKNRKH